MYAFNDFFDMLIDALIKVKGIITLRSAEAEPLRNAAVEKASSACVLLRLWR